MKCELCNQESEELCNDLVCRACHVSISFDDCVSGTYSAKVLLNLWQASGIDPKVAREHIKKLYPDAKIEGS